MKENEKGGGFSAKLERPGHCVGAGLGNSSEISLLHYETVWNPDLYRAVAA